MPSLLPPNPQRCGFYPHHSLPLVMSTDDYIMCKPWDCFSVFIPPDLFTMVDTVLRPRVLGIHGPELWPLQSQPTFPSANTFFLLLPPMKQVLPQSPTPTPTSLSVQVFVREVSGVRSCLHTSPSMAWTKLERVEPHSSVHELFSFFFFGG